MPANNQNHGQKGSYQARPSSIRRGAVSVQSLSEYQKLQPHKNEKDGLLQYKDYTKAQK